MELTDLTAAEAAREIRARRLSSLELVEALLARIEATEPALRAWALVDAEGARTAARAADAALGEGGARPLHGVPFGVKDIIDTGGLRTAAGFPAFADRVPAADAEAVARLRAAGAIVLGKTVTTQFAFADPPPTANPWRGDRTPGGSSSGSAASVAARQVSFALGTQTGGSVVRPAYFCGAVGFKPTRDRIPRRGAIPLAWSLDHVGVIARSVEDVGLVLRATSGGSPEPDRTQPPRLGLLAPALELADPRVAGACTTSAAALRAAGAVVEETRLPWEWDLATATHHVVMQSEAAEVHRELLPRHPDVYAPILRAYVEVGLAIPAAAYVHARRLQRRLRSDIGGLAAQFDALLLPSSASQAPEPSSTGDSGLQAPFSLTGLPEITLPTGVSSDGLPNGLQLVGRHGQDEALLAVARWCEAVLPAPSRPTSELARVSS